MPKEYCCPLCNKVFIQKVDFTRHTTNKKTPCISLTELQQLAISNQNAINEKQQLINTFKNYLNILRDNEGLTGEKALRNMSYLFVLKMIEPHLDEDLNLSNFNYLNNQYYEDEYINFHLDYYLKFVRFSNMAKENEDNLANNLGHLWKIILSVNPATNKIFLPDKKFDIKYQSTFKKLIDNMAQLDISKTPYDVLGSAYEEVAKDIMTGKVLGQFFTQPLIKKLMVKLIDPQVYPDGKIDTCADPTMGTGGFLITYLKNIIEQAKQRNIKLDWNFIKTEGLYGKELEPDTYQLALSNMLISSGHMFEHFECGDSIRYPILRKFDNILANPPFGIKGLKYDDFRMSNREEYVPIRSGNAVSLFIQAIIYMLKIGGKCAVVLPDGQDLFSKSDSTLIAIREYLMKTCDLKEIIYIPSGVFEYTSIKTCVFYFIKKREGTDVLETKLKQTKTGRVSGKEYKFSKTHQTHKVRFYETRIVKIGNEEELDKKLIVEVPIEQIAENSYALNYTEYIEEERNAVLNNNDIVIKTLGEICEFLPKSKRQASYGEKEGQYPFFKSSIKIDSYVNIPDYNEESLIIGDGGEANINYGVKFSTSDHCYILQNTNLLCYNLKYVYYYLFHNLSMIQKLYKGATIKNISKTNITNIKIPIPSIERQNEIVKYLDFIYEKANKTSEQKIAELKQLNEFYLTNQQLYGFNENKTLGEICEFLPKSKRQASYGEKEGQYPFFKSSIKIDSYVNIPDYNKESLIIGDGGEANINYGINFSTSDHCYILQNTNELFYNLKYVYYYLFHNLSIMQKLYKGVTIKNISKTNISNIQIPIPSLKRQQEIVEYCEKNDALIKQLEEEIETNKTQAKLFLLNIINTQNLTDDNVDDVVPPFIPSDEENNNEHNDNNQSGNNTEDDTEQPATTTNINNILIDAPEPTPSKKRTTLIRRKK